MVRATVTKAVSKSGTSRSITGSSSTAHGAAAVGPVAHHVEPADHQADEETSGVAHEDRRRLKVEEQEAGQRPGERRGQRGALDVAVHQEEVAAEGRRR